MPITSRWRGFTLVELQIAIVALSIAFVTLASVLVAEQRSLKRLHSNRSTLELVNRTKPQHL